MQTFKLITRQEPRVLCRIVEAAKPDKHATEHKARAKARKKKRRSKR